MRSKIDKAKTILKAFTGNVDVPEPYLQQRRDKCEDCAFNSKNVPKDALDEIDKLRVSLIKSPFCTLCKCQIQEKTTQASEACGAENTKHKLNWSRMKLKTKLYTVENKSPNTVNIQPNGDSFKIELLEAVENKEVKFTMQLSKVAAGVEVGTAFAGCGACTHASFDSIRKEINITIKGSALSGESFSKNVYLSYKYKGKQTKQTIVVEGKI